MKKKPGYCSMRTATIILLFLLSFGIAKADITGGITDISVNGNDIIVTGWLKNTGTEAVEGIIELSPRYKEALPLDIANYQTSCDKEWEVHSDFYLLPDEMDTFSLTSYDRAAGRYEIVMLTTNDCCAGKPVDQCWALEPFGWGTSFGIVSVTESTCQSHNHWECWLNNVYWYDSCGGQEDLKEDCGAAGCSQGKCVGTPNTLQGYFSDVTSPTKVKIGEPIAIKGKFTAEKAGQYLLEAGIIQGAQTYKIVSSRSACDDSIHYAGSVVQLSQGQTEEFEFTVRDYGTDGSYTLTVGAYNGCSEELGPAFYIVSTADRQITIGNPFQLDPVKAAIAIVVLACLFALFMVWRKKK